MDFNDDNRAPLDPFIWAGYAANHAQPPETVEIFEIVQPKPVPQRMPETSGPKLRVVRDLTRGEAEDGSAEIAMRQQAAIDKWHSTGAGNGNAAFFQLGVDLRRTGMNDNEVRTILPQGGQ